MHTMRTRCNACNGYGEGAVDAMTAYAKETAENLAKHELLRTALWVAGGLLVLYFITRPERR